MFRTGAVRVIVWGVAAAVLLAGCGGGPLDTGSQVERVDAWADLVCDGAKFHTASGAILANMDLGSSDIVVRAVCVHDDVDGEAFQYHNVRQTFDIYNSESAKQTLDIYNAEAALETFLSSAECNGNKWVRGKDWVATTGVPELATDLVEAGGELFC